MKREAALAADRRASRERTAIIRPLRKQVTERERTGKASATPERLLKAADLAEVTPQGTQRINPTGLDSLLRHRQISIWEFQAGDEFRRDAAIAKRDPAPSTVDWDGIGGNFGPRVPLEFSSQSIHDAIDRDRRARAALRGAGGTDLHDLIIIEQVCIHDWGPLAIGRDILGRKHKRDAVVAGVAVIQLCLRRLAAHYAYGRQQRKTTRSAMKSA